MEDQFGGRTDDDLFFDEDFEPVAAESKPLEEPTPELPPPPVVAPVETKPPPVAAPLAPSHVQRAAAPSSQPKGGLAASRHAGGSGSGGGSGGGSGSGGGGGGGNQKPAPRPRQNNRVASSNHAQPSKPSNNNHNSQPSAEAATVSKDKPPASGAKEPPPASTTNNGTPTTTPATAAAGVSSEARLASGANPRTKLTEQELAAKMARMEILNAERKQKFEKSQEDRRAHDQAYQKSMEETRKRRAADAERRKREDEEKRRADTERRKRDDEERRQMDEEREKNRARKLQAMGGWDQEKMAEEAGEERRGFRGVNGGVRGARGGGLGASRFADGNEEERERFGGESGRGRGRGRGGRGGGRGGRGGFERDGFDGERPTKAPATAEKKPPPNLRSEDLFPSLPAGKKPSMAKAKGSIATNVPAKTGDAAEKEKPKDSDALSPLSPLGNWGDEMEAFDEKIKGKA